MPAETLTRAEVQALMAACGRRGPTGIRNRALIVVLWRSGLRSDECLSLEPRDVNGDVLTVRHGKGDKSRKVAIDEEALSILHHWLDRRAKIPKLRRNAPVFCTMHGTKLDDGYLRRTMARLGEKAKIDKRVHPHGLRHTFASDLVDEGYPENVIQALLGHENAGTTRGYIRKINPKEAFAAIRSRPSWSNEDG